MKTWRKNGPGNMPCDSVGWCLITFGLVVGCPVLYCSKELPLEYKFIICPEFRLQMDTAFGRIVKPAAESTFAVLLIIIICITLVILFVLHSMLIRSKLGVQQNPCFITIILISFKLLRGRSVHEMLLAWITPI